MAKILNFRCIYLFIVISTVSVTYSTRLKLAVNNRRPNSFSNSQQRPSLLSSSYHNPRKIHNSDGTRTLRHILGRLQQIETNVMSTMGEGDEIDETVAARGEIEQQQQQQHQHPLMKSLMYPTNDTMLEDYKQYACTEGCSRCLEEYPFLDDEHKKRSELNGVNCGPMCDCADSCTHQTIEQVDREYGGETSCWRRVYFRVILDVPFK